MNLWSELKQKATAVLNEARLLAKTLEDIEARQGLGAQVLTPTECLNFEAAIGAVDCAYAEITEARKKIAERVRESGA